MRIITTLTPNQIEADPRIQRALDPRRVEAIAKSLNLNALGLPLVSERKAAGDVMYVVIDGQHRIAALKAADKGNYPLEVGLFVGLDLQAEAELFRIHNATKQLSAVDKFRISLIEGDPEALAIDAIVTRNGYTTVTGQRESCTAVATLRTVHRRDEGATLNAVLAVTMQAWGIRRYATHQTILLSLANVFDRYGDTINSARLADKLRSDKDASDPVTFLGHVRSLGQATGAHVSDAGAGKLVTIYNKDYQASSVNRLAAWK